jgi:hypothetical protein
MKKLKAAGRIALTGVSFAVAGCASSSRDVAAPDQMADICRGVPDMERQRPTFLQSSGIESVRPFMGEQHYVKFTLPQLRGADIFVRAGPGVTKQWVARVLRCHVAWRDAAGLSNQDGFEDPSTVDRPDLSFIETETGFVVRIAGHDKAEGEEILRRAQRLTEPSGAARN